MTAQPTEEVHVEDHHGPWTEADYFALGETPDRIELFDGSLIVSPAHALLHQYISDQLVAALKRAPSGDHLAVSAVNVRLQASQILIPDAVVTSASLSQQVVEAEQVALVCEVVLPGNAGNDRVLKMCLYAAAGIPWYLLVEPAEDGRRISASLFRLDNGHYVQQARAGGGEVLRLPDPVGVGLDPAELLRR